MVANFLQSAQLLGDACVSLMNTVQPVFNLTTLGIKQQLENFIDVSNRT